MVEAMACGTPVIAFRCGSVPEVIEDGANGFVVDSYDEALSAIDRVRLVDRHGVRRCFEHRFTARRMAEDYIRIYQAVIAARMPPPFEQAAQLSIQASTITQQIGDLFSDSLNHETARQTRNRLTSRGSAGNIPDGELFGVIGS
jgi:hypothetical protein